MKKPTFFLFLTLVVSFHVNCTNNIQPKLTIATAANMQFAMKTIMETFSAETGIPGNVVISSSGKLTAQIKEGAPYHVLVSADMKYPNELYHTGFTDSIPQIYAYGKLVLWGMNNTIPFSIENLANESIRHIALANPKTAPYGRAAKEVLEHFSLYENLQEKLVFGESIAQTNQFILSEAAQVGFTAQSVVLSPQVKDKGNWIALPDSTYSPIAQGIVVIKNPNEQLLESARTFYRFLFTAKAREILLKYGYETPQNQ